MITVEASAVKANTIEARYGSIDARHRGIEGASTEVKASLEASAGMITVEASAVKANTIEARYGSIDARHRGIEEASTEVRSIKERPSFCQSHIRD
jgi:hypothetical protein